MCLDIFKYINTVLTLKISNNFLFLSSYDYHTSCILFCKNLTMEFDFIHVNCQYLLKICVCHCVFPKSICCSKIRKESDPLKQNLLIQLFMQECFSFCFSVHSAFNMFKIFIYFFFFVQLKQDVRFISDIIFIQDSFILHYNPVPNTHEYTKCCELYVI